MDRSLYILAGYDDATESCLSAIQNKLYTEGFIGTQTKNIPMHITLGAYSTDMEEELISRINEVCAETAPISVTFNHVGIFGGGRVMFICPDTNHQLLDLKENFGSAVGWTPHTTMLIDEPEVIIKALPVVLGEFSSFTGEVTELHFYEFFPARHICSVKLKGNNNG